jgi:hypothetical protein
VVPDWIDELPLVAVGPPTYAMVVPKAGDANAPKTKRAKTALPNADALIRDESDVPDDMLDFI